MWDLYALVWSIAHISGGAHLLFRCLTELSQRLSVLLTILHLLPHSTHSPYAVRWPLFLFFTDIILAVALSSWLAVYHHLWNDPATRGSLLMLTDILLASPTRESIALIIVFSPLLLNSGTLYLNLSFLTHTTCRRLRGRSIITFGGVKTFLSMLRNLFSLSPFYVFFIRFYLNFYSFNQLFAARAGQGHSCPSWSCCAPLQGHAIKKSKL